MKFFGYRRTPEFRLPEPDVYPAMPASPPLPESSLTIRDALVSVHDAQLALKRAENCWNAVQLEDALRSAKHFVEDARRRLNAGAALREKEVGQASEEDAGSNSPALHG